MDFNKIFLKDACPTSIGGQAIMEGIMMRGPEKTAIAVRLPDGRIHMKTQPTLSLGKWSKVPLVRGVVSFIVSLITGTKTIMYSADVLEKYVPEEYEPDKTEVWLEKKLGKEKAWNATMAISVVLAMVLAIGVFMLLPTAIVGLLKKVTDSVILLNIVEGAVRIALFIGYIALIPKLEDINTVFKYHGAEHKTIHCYENNLPLTPENAQTFYRLHPRCGTSFLMFVMIVAIIVHVFMGWPNVWMRIGMRLLALPLIAGISYELLKWAGRSQNRIVEFLSLPGIYLQKLTTREPDFSQLEVAIAAVKAVLPDEDAKAQGVSVILPKGVFFEGFCNLNGEPIDGEVTYYNADGAEI